MLQLIVQVVGGVISCSNVSVVHKSMHASHHVVCELAWQRKAIVIFGSLLACVPAVCVKPHRITFDVIAFYSTFRLILSFRRRFVRAQFVCRSQYLDSDPPRATANISVL